MKIQVGGMSEGVHQYRFQVTASELGLGKDFPDDVNVEATLDKTGSQIFLNAGIRTVASFECDRCVTQFEAALSSSYKLYYVWDRAEVGRFDPSEFQVIPAGLNVIDISEDVRQTILLSVPLKLLCRDGCKGLCPHCGKNSNETSCSCTDKVIDTRWEKLRSLQKNNMQDQP